MSKTLSDFQSGKLQVARSIVAEMSRIHSGTHAGKELLTAFYAINRADTAEIVEVEKPSHNKQMATVLEAELRKFSDPENPDYTLRTHIPQLATHLNSALKEVTKA